MHVALSMTRQGSLRHVALKGNWRFTGTLSPGCAQVIPKLLPGKALPLESAGVATVPGSHSTW